MEDVLEVPSAGIEQGAETTPEQSPSSPEVSPDNPETVVPAEEQGLQPKPSAATDKPSGVPQEKQNPWDKDPRFLEANQQRKQFESQLPVLEKLSALGLSSIEDADYLVNQTQEWGEYKRKFHEEPMAIVNEWKSAAPQAWTQVWDAMVKESTPHIASQILKELGDIAQEAGASPEVLAFLQKQSVGGKQQPARTGVDPERQQFQQEKQQFESQRESDFLDRVGSDVQGMIRQKIEPLTKGVTFTDEEQKALFEELVAKDLARAQEQNWKFSNTLKTLQDRRHGFSPNQAREILKAHEQHAVQGGLLEKIVNARLRVLNLSRSSQTTKPGIKEPRGVAGPGNTNLGKSQNETKLAELKAKRERGEISDVDLMRESMLL